ncbi:hypothetical protein [Streptomyces sp. NPDC002746]
MPLGISELTDPLLQPLTRLAFAARVTVLVETQRAVIAAEVERERIRRPQLPAGDGDAS